VRVAFVLIGAALAVGVQAAPQQSGWVNLFDGKTIAHWRGYKETGVPPGWKVQDGAITRVAEGADLVSREQYADFEFEFEWKVPPGGNSGVMFRVTEALEATYHSGPEYQLLDNALHSDGKNPLTSAASSHSIAAPNHDMTKPVGQWNQSRLLVKGPHVEHWLNGEKIVEYELWNHDWKQRVQASKFKDMPRYGLMPTGHIALQDHGDWVAFRNIRIRRLP